MPGNPIIVTQLKINAGATPAVRARLLGIQTTLNSARQNYTDGEQATFWANFVEWGQQNLAAIDSGAANAGAATG